MSTNEEFSGFANAPVDEDGKRLDFRDVPNYEDETEAGETRKQSQTTESSIVGFRTNDQSTNGAPAATVPADEGDAPDADAAGGEGANDA